MLALALLVTGCGGSTEAEEDSRAGGGGSDASKTVDRVEPLEGSAPTPKLPVTVASADKREVTVRSAERVVPLTGSLSEIVFSLGLGESVVARDVTATFEQAKDLPVVTRAHDVSAEGVLSLKPTLVLAQSGTGPAESLEQIRDAGVPLLVIPPAQELDDVGTRIDAVAEALGVSDAGEKLRERTEKRVADAGEGVPDYGGDQEKAPRVAFLYLRGTASVYLLGGARSGASSLIEAAGAVDAGKESGLTKDFTAITSEALAKAAPDVILVMSKGLESVEGVDGLLKIPGIAETPAGMDRRIASVDDGILLTYGPRTNTVISSLVEQIHGEAR